MSNNDDIKIYPSLMAADYSRLQQELADAVDAGADGLHLDVMDGHFVPNLTFGPDLVRKIRSLCGLEFDVHLMVTNPELFYKPFADAGADSLSFHIELNIDYNNHIKQIRDLGCRVGVAIKPSTDLAMLSEDVWPLIDRILVMSVEPGFGGQSFIDISEKLDAVQEIIKEHTYTIDIQVDGGIKPETAPQVVAHGAKTLVAGSAVFRGSGSMQERIQAIRQSS